MQNIVTYFFFFQNSLSIFVYFEKNPCFLWILKPFLFQTKKNKDVIEHTPVGWNSGNMFSNIFLKLFWYSLIRISWSISAREFKMKQPIGTKLIMSQEVILSYFLSVRNDFSEKRTVSKIGQSVSLYVHNYQLIN